MDNRKQFTVYTTIRVKHPDQDYVREHLEYNHVSFEYTENDGNGWHGNDNCIFYSDFKRENSRLTAVTGILREKLKKHPLIVTIGDARVASQEGYATQFNNASKIHLATYVAKVNVLLTDHEYGNMLKTRAQGYLNAYMLPCGIDIKEENIEGLWLESKCNEFEVVVYDESVFRASTIKKSEIAFWKNSDDEWWFKVGPNGVEELFVFPSKNEIPKPEVKGKEYHIIPYHLESNNKRQANNGGRWSFSHERSGELERSVESHIINLLIDRRKISPADFEYEFPAFIGPIERVKLKELNEKNEIYKQTFWKINTKQEFIKFWNDLHASIKEARSMNQYSFHKLADNLEELIPKLLDANQKHFFRQSTTYGLLAEIYQFLDMDVSMDKFFMADETELDSKILNIFLQNHKHLNRTDTLRSFTNAVNELKQQSGKLLNFEDLDRVETISSLQEAFESAVNMEDLVNYLEKILADRWERIRETNLAYTRCAANAPLSLLCQRLAKLVADYRKGDKIIYQYLIPTLTGCYDKFSDVHLNELKINQFILDEKNENAYDLRMIYNHHTYALDDPQAMDTAFWDPHLPDNEDGMGTPISESLVLRLIHHSKETREYHEAYEALQEAKKSDSVSFYMPLKQLATGLMKGSTSGSGSEATAGCEAMEAINAFHIFLDENPDIREGLLALRTGNSCLNYVTNLREPETLKHVWDILTGVDKVTINCVYLNSNKITSLLNYSQNQKVLRSAFDLAEDRFKQATQRFTRACEDNQFTFDQSSYPCPAGVLFDLLSKHHQRMNAADAIAQLNSLHIPNDCPYPSIEQVDQLKSLIEMNDIEKGKGKDKGRDSSLPQYKSMNAEGEKPEKDKGWSPGIRHFSPPNAFHGAEPEIRDVQQQSLNPEEISVTVTGTTTTTSTPQLESTRTPADRDFRKNEKHLIAKIADKSFPTETTTTTTHTTTTTTTPPVNTFVQAKQGARVATGNLRTESKKTESFGDRLTSDVSTGGLAGIGFGLIPFAVFLSPILPLFIPLVAVIVVCLGGSILRAAWLYHKSDSISEKIIPAVSPANSSASYKPQKYFEKCSDNTDEKRETFVDGVHTEKDMEKQSRNNLGNSNGEVQEGPKRPRMG